MYYDVIRKARHNRLSHIEAIRKQLKAAHQIIDVIDFKSNKSEKRTISSIANTVLSTPKFSSFLYHLGTYLRVQTILETGTSLGINALYLSQIPGIKKVTTIEGSPIIAELAQKNFVSFATIELINQELHSSFVPTLVRCNPQLVFLDADHRSTTIDFCLKAIEENNPGAECVVIHDINWSRDMNLKWKEICQNQKYPLTIDIFHAGIIFPNRNMPKQHFVLRF